MQSSTKNLDSLPECGRACCSCVCGVCLACSRSLITITVIRSVISSSSASSSRAWKKHVYLWTHEVYQRTRAHTHTHSHTSARLPHANRWTIANLFTLPLCLLFCPLVCMRACVYMLHVFNFWASNRAFKMDSFKGDPAFSAWLAVGTTV